MTRLFVVTLIAIVVAFSASVVDAGAFRIGTGASVDYGIGNSLSRTDAGDINLIADGAYSFNHFLMDFAQGASDAYPSSFGLSWRVKGSVDDPDFFAGLKATTRWLDENVAVGIGPQLGIIVADKLKLGLVVTYYPVENEWRVGFENVAIFKPIW